MKFSVFLPLYEEASAIDFGPDCLTDRHTDGLSQTTFLDVLEVVHPKAGLISYSIFCTMPILPLTWKYSKI